MSIYSKTFQMSGIPAFVISPEMRLGSHSELLQRSTSSMHYLQVIPLSFLRHLFHTISIQQHRAGFTVHFVDAEDSAEEDLLHHFDDCFHFIESARGDVNGGVLVHCFAGYSRSSTIVLSYLMRKEGLSLKDATENVMKVCKGWKGCGRSALSRKYNFGILQAIFCSTAAALSLPLPPAYPCANRIGLDQVSTVRCSAQEEQIWKIISREILNLSLNAKFCISKNMAPLLYVFRTGPCFQKCKFMHSETD